MVEATKNTMIYRYLGPTGLKVSVLGYGTYMTDDTKNPQELTTSTVKRALEYGINFFDTAELYDSGKAEICLGNAFKELNVRREEIVVSTKIIKEHFIKPCHPNGAGLSRKHVIEGVRNSLKRLQLEYVDVVFAHRPDLETPLEETVRAFSYVIDQGWAFYWGVSEWTAARTTEAIRLAKQLGLHAPIVEQPQYNMLWRNNVEKDLNPIFESSGLGTTTWSPLCGGILTGKYNEGVVPEDTTRGGAGFFQMRVLPMVFGPKTKDNSVKLLKALGEYAKELGYTQAQLALAWGIANRDVSTQLLGFSRVEQVDENLKALDLYKIWNKDIEARVEAILQNAPATEYNAITYKPLPGRRQQRVVKETTDLHD